MSSNKKKLSTSSYMIAHQALIIFQLALHRKIRKDHLAIEEYLSEQKESVNIPSS